MKNVALTLPVLALTLGLAGCETDTAGPDNPLVETADFLQVVHQLDVLFVSRTEPTTTAPDALFEGQVTVDAAGCLRLETTGDYGLTPVWPHGYGLELDGDVLRLLDESGTAVAAIDSPVRLGGGEVDQLGPELGFSTNDQELANSRCPGKFWVVSDVL